MTAKPSLTVYIVSSEESYCEVGGLALVRRKCPGARTIWRLEDAEGTSVLYDGQPSAPYERAYLDALDRAEAESKKGMPTDV